MKRGRGQVLYKFLPEQIVDFSDTRTIGKVTYWRCGELAGINKQRLIETIESRIRSKFEDRKAGYPRSSDDYVILEPLSIELDIFPLTFLCRSCGAARRYSSVKSLRSELMRTNYRCPRCHVGIMDQHDFVHYHECGEIESFVVRECPIHGFGHVVLNRNNSDSPKNWWWQCRECSHASPRNIARVGAHCRTCAGDHRMRHAPFRKGEVFYPHTFSLINVSSLEEFVLTDLDWELFLAEYLGIIQEGRTKDLLVGRGGKLTRGIELERKRQRLMEKGIPPEYIDSVFREVGLGDSDEEVSNAIGILESRLQLQQATYTILSQELMGYNETIRTESTRSLHNVVDSIEGPAKERMKNSPDKLRRLGFSNAWLAVDLPVVSVAYGYSRGDPTLESSVIRAFPRNKDYPGKTPVYGLKIETEAILMELNRLKVMSWLRENDWITEPGDTLNDNEAKAWFLRNVHLSNIPPFDAIATSDRTTWAVCNLLHTLSHLFLKKASGLAGLDKGSLREILFPNVPAFCIYASNSQGYQLGGMVTLFENSMSYWLDRAKNEVQYCLYDPLCVDADGACHACLHLPEISCERFNRDLSRAFIIGRDEDPHIVGYWE